MAYILRFVQTYRPEARTEFLALEAKFAELERRNPRLPQGRRSQPCAGKEPTNAFIWECQFASMQEVQQALSALSGSPEHEALFRLQSPLMIQTWTEIYETLDL
jgi:hypothetical protein